MSPVFRSLYTALMIAALFALTGCPESTEPAPEFEIFSTPPACILAVSTGDIESEDSKFYVFAFPEGKLIYSGSRSDVLTIWTNGMLYKGTSDVEWWDLNLISLEYEPDPGVDLTSWNTPIAVHPEERVIFAMGHQVPPLRVLQAHFLDGTEPEEVNRTTADILEPLDMLPSNGWPMFYLDRPGTRFAVTPDDAPTRRLRLFYNREAAGEFSGILGLWPLKGEVIMHRDEGWYLLEPGDWRGVVPKTMSLDEISGELRPLERDGDSILFGMKETADDSDVATGYKLYRYGAYSRQVEEVWDAWEAVESGEILAGDVIGPDDYLLLLSVSPWQSLELGRLTRGQWESLGSVTLPEPSAEFFLFLLEEPPIVLEPEHPEEFSVVEDESVHFNSDGLTEETGEVSD